MAFTSQPSILIAEDNSSLRYLFARVLMRAGFKVETTDSGDTAFGFLQHNLPDLIVLDLGLPGRSGVEIVNYLQASPIHIATQIVVVTGNVQAHSMPELARVEYVLLKPVSTRELVSTVTNIFDRCVQ